MNARRARPSPQQLLAWRTFFHMQELLRGRIEQQLQNDSGLSNADYTVLVALVDWPGGNPRAFELSQALGWEKSRLHHQLSRMAKRGLLVQKPGEGRSMHAAITDEGRAALRQAAQRHAEEVQRLVFDRLTPEQVDQLGAISSAILAGLLPERFADASEATGKYYDVK